MIGNSDPDYADVLADSAESEQYRLLPFRSPAAVEVFEYGFELARQRRGGAGHDLVSRLVNHVPEDGVPLSDRDFRNYFLLLVVAGNETTRHAISHTIERPARPPRPARAPAGRPVAHRARGRGMPALGVAGLPLPADGDPRRGAPRETVAAGDKVVAVVRGGEPGRAGLRRPVPLRRHCAAAWTMSRSARAGHTSAWATSSPAWSCGSCSRSSCHACPRRSAAPARWPASAPTSSTASRPFPWPSEGVLMAIDTAHRTEPQDAGADVGQVVARLRQQGVDVVRVSYADLIGVDRGRDVLVDELERVVATAWRSAARSTTPPRGATSSRCTAGWTPGCRTSTSSPTCATLTPLPLGAGRGVVRRRRPHPRRRPAEEAPRHVARRVSDRLAELGLTAVVGPELEFFVCEQDPDDGLAAVRRRTRQRLRRRAQGRPARAARHDAAAPARRRSARDGRQPRVLRPASSRSTSTTPSCVDAADRAFRLKSAVQEIARHAGPARDLHGQAVQRRGRQRLPPARLAWSTRRRRATCSATPPARTASPRRGRRRRRPGHAPALAALLNPTINSYKRFGPDTLAPWLIDWGLDNRSAMVRIPPGAGCRESRMEVRLGDATANPYLATPPGRRGVPRDPGRAGAAGAARGLRLRPRPGRRSCRSGCRRRSTRWRPTRRCARCSGRRSSTRS